MSFFTRIGTFFRMLYNSVFGKAILDAAAQLISVVGRSYADMLMVEAQKAVAEAEIKFPDPGAGLEKRTFVQDYLIASAKNSGFVIASSLINFIIESALTALAKASTDNVG